MRILLFSLALICGLNMIWARSLSWNNYGFNYDEYSLELPKMVDDVYDYGLDHIIWQTDSPDVHISKEHNTNDREEKNNNNDSTDEDDEISSDDHIIDITKSSEEIINNYNSEPTNYDNDSKDDNDSDEKFVNELLNAMKDDENISDDHTFDVSKSSEERNKSSNSETTNDEETNKSNDSESTNDENDSKNENDSNEEDDLEELWRSFMVLRKHQDISDEHIFDNLVVDVKKSSEEIINNNDSEPINNDNDSKEDDNNERDIVELANSNHEDVSVDNMFGVSKSLEETNKFTDSEPTSVDNDSEVDEDVNEKDIEDLIDIIMGFGNDDVLEFSDNHIMDVTKSSEETNKLTDSEPTNDDNDSKGDEDDNLDKDIEELINLLKMYDLEKSLEETQNIDDSESVGGDNDSMVQDNGISEQELEELINLMLNLNTNIVTKSSEETGNDSESISADNDSKDDNDDDISEREIEDLVNLILSLSNDEEIKSNNDDVTITSEESTNYKTKDEDININKDIDNNQDIIDDSWVLRFGTGNLLMSFILSSEINETKNSNDYGKEIGELQQDLDFGQNSYTDKTNVEEDNNDSDNNENSSDSDNSNVDNNNDDEISLVLMPLNEDNQNTLDNSKYDVIPPTTNPSINIPQSYYYNTLFNSINNQDGNKNPHNEFELIKPIVQEQQQTWDLRTLDNEFVIDKKNSYDMEKSTWNLVPYMAQKPRDILASKINDNIVDYNKIRADFKDLTTNLQKQEVDLNMDFWRVIGDYQDQYMNKFENDITEVSSTLDKLKQYTVELQNMQQKLYINNLLKAMKGKTLIEADNK